jgi:hypothetical protein
VEVRQLGFGTRERGDGVLRLRGCSSEVRVLRENYEYIGPLSGVVLIDKGESAIAAKHRVLLVLTKQTAMVSRVSR